MIKKCISFLAFCIPLVLQAQVTISVQLPSAGMIQKDQLWNLVLSNSGTGPVEITVLLNLQDAASGQTVLSGGSRSLLLGKGVKIITPSDVQPVQYSFVTGTFNGNYLPLGNYMACYTVSRAMGERIESLADECVRVSIGPLSPPLLNAPADKSVLRTAIPQLSWSPPAPLGMFDELSYDLNIVEVQEGQAPSDALLYNTPLYSKAHSKLTYENYPPSYARLEAGKTYAWQVIARNGQSYAASTEVWTFSLAKDSIKATEAGNSYILIKNSNEPSGVGYVFGNSLNVKYYSFDKEHQTMIRFLDVNGKILTERKQKISYGDNFLNFSLDQRFQKGQLYAVQIKDLQNNIHTASFSIK